MAVSFDFRRRLGAGYFGEVWGAIETGLGHQVALKCIPPDKIINQGNFFQEAQVLKASEHPNIVHVNDTGTLDDGRVYVSMEYLSGGSVEDEAQGAPLSLSRAKRRMVDVLRGLGHAHSRGIVHRDVKPGNILIGNNGEGKLSDFGLALPDIQGLDMTQLKQYRYVLHLAPEVRRIEDYTQLSDIYACGVTLYRLVNGDSNLPQITPVQAQIQARRGRFSPRNGYRQFVPQSLKRMINRAISVEPASRYQSAEEMRHALEHQHLCVDWEESRSPGRQVWTGRANNSLYYEVVKHKQRDGRWTVDTRKGSDPNSRRRIGSLCEVDMRKEDADKRARRILQDLTVGRA
ncbi:MAG: serine/threonine-protein kinase [Pirellulaceae bacterium]